MQEKGENHASSEVETVSMRDALSTSDWIEQWYPQLAEFTFKTVTLPVTVEVSKLLCSLYEGAAIMTMIELQEQDIRADHPDCLRSTPAVPLFEHEKEILQNLATDLQQAIDEVGGSGAFVRLSTRSPKDAALSCPRTRQILEESISKVPLIPGTKYRSCSDLLHFTRAISWALRVKTGEETVELLTSSQRVYQDLSGYELQFGNERTDEGPRSSCGVNFIVRAWEDLEPEWEFRCFVVDGRLTAITQYYPDCFVPGMFENKSEIFQRINVFFTTCIDPIWKQSFYTLDIYVPSDPQKPLRLVEINQPPPTAGSALFDYKNEVDKAIINGQSPFEMRVRSEPKLIEQAEAHPPLVRFLQLLRSKYPSVDDGDELQQPVDAEALEPHLGFTCSCCGEVPVGYRFSCVGWREGEKDCTGLALPVSDLCEWCFNDRKWDRRLQFKLFNKVVVEAPPQPPQEESLCCTM